MKDLNCINCDNPNLVDNIAESFKCGECGEVNPGIDIDILYSDYVYLNKQYSELADRLRTQDRDVERLTRLLIDNKIETDYDMENEVLKSKLAKRDQLIEQVYPWIKDPSAIPFVRVRLQWIKQVEELKGGK